MRLECWTDGSGLPAGGPGGWAFVLVALDGNGEILREREGCGPLDYATNQMAELEAVLQGLRTLERPTAVTVVSDSEYVINGFRQGWVERWRETGWLTREGDPVKNRPLWEALAFEVERHDVTWRHVHGHAKVIACDACGWTGPRPPRKRKFDPCACGGTVELRDAHPFNARCDELAGKWRMTVLERVGAGT